MTIFNAGHLQVGREAPQFESGRRRLKLQVRLSPRVQRKGAGSVAKKSRAGVTAVPGVQHDQPQSTNVSSPLQQVKKRRTARNRQPAGDTTSRYNGYADDSFVVSVNQVSDDDSDESEGFEPVRQLRTHKDDPHSGLGHPITSDDTMSALNEIHRIVVEGFVRGAKSLGEEVCRLETHMPLVRG